MTLKSSIKRVWKQARSANGEEHAAAASEYASVLAVLIIAAIVSVTMFGRRVNTTVSNVDHQVASLAVDESGVVSATDSGTSPGKRGDKGGGKGGGKGAGKGGGKPGKS